jgi:type I restriction enzyme S subunit
MSEEIGNLLELVTAGEWGNNQGTPGGIDTGVIRSANITKDHQFNTKEIVIRSIEERKRQKKMLRHGDILLEKSGGSPDQPVGRVLFYDLNGEHTCSNFIAILRPSQQVDAKFLYYSLCNLYERGVVKNYQQQTTGIINLQLREYLRESIYFPPLPEQKKIAEILSGVDRKHSKLKGRINALSMIRIQLVREFLKQGMHKETDHANGLPQGWEERTLGEVSEFRRGSFPQPYGNPEWFDDAGYPFVQVYDIDDNGKLKPNTKNKISQAAADKSVFIPSGSLIVSLQGSIGRVAITQYDSYVDRTILIFTDYERILSREYFSLLVGDLFSRKGEVADGGVIKTITKQTLKEFSIRIPPLDEQQKLSEVVRAIDHSISLCKEQLFKVDLLRQSLAGDLLSGRKRDTL